MQHLNDALKDSLVLVEYSARANDGEHEKGRKNGRRDKHQLRERNHTLVQVGRVHCAAVEKLIYGNLGKGKNCYCFAMAVFWATNLQLGNG